MPGTYIAEYHIAIATLECKDWIPDVVYSTDGTTKYHPWWSFCLNDEAEVEILSSGEKGRWGDLKKKLRVTQEDLARPLKVRVLIGVWECDPIKIVNLIYDSKVTIYHRNRQIRDLKEKLTSLERERAALEKEMG